ncbi:MAG TPA: flagellar biosynthetic protein FliO [Geobacteraceae bacterium]
MRTFAAAALLCVPAVARAAGGRGGEGGSMTVAVFQMLASLAIVIGIIYLLYYLSTRWFRGMAGGKGRSGRIRVIETRYLAPKRSLLIVEVGGEYLLLGSGNEGVQLIKKLENGEGLDAEGVPNPFQPAPEAIRRKFDDLLGKVRERMAGMGKNDAIPENFGFPADESGLLTVEEMIARIQGGSGAAGPQQVKAKEMGVAC